MTNKAKGVRGCYATYQKCTRGKSRGDPSRLDGPQVSETRHAVSVSTIETGVYSCTVYSKHRSRLYRGLVSVVCTLSLRSVIISKTDISVNCRLRHGL